MDRELNSQSKEILDELAVSGHPPADSITPESRRTLLDEVLANRGETLSLQTITDVSISGPQGELDLRLYYPNDDGSLPMLVYFHGGGWVRGSIESHDPLCRHLAVAAGCLVVSVDYRLAPEHTFPAPLVDAYAALEWAADNAERLRGDRDRIAVGGDSAGGNLAAALSLLARDRKGPEICHQQLLYPMTHRSNEFESYQQNSDYFITPTAVDWQWEQYLGTDIHAQNPYAVPGRETNFEELPPATVLTCGFDILRDEGRRYTEQLKNAGNNVSELHYSDQIHAFLNFPELDRAQEAYSDIATVLKTSFN